MTNYKKLSEAEMKNLYVNLRGYFEENENFTNIRKSVLKYFPEAKSILISIDSEYNDSTYDNRVSAVYVYGDNDIELGLTRENREKFNEEIKSIDPYIEESTEEMEDVVLYVNKNLPGIYMKTGE